MTLLKDNSLSAAKGHESSKMLADDIKTKPSISKRQ